MQFGTLAKTMLTMGFVGVGTATVVSYLNPATGYELSIYTETPISFWILISFALLISILVVFSRLDRTMTVLGAFLGGLSMTAIVLLPIIRGYHYMGTGDALGHLGTTRDLNAGRMVATEIVYPSVHTLGSIVHDLTGFELHHSLSVVVVLFVICFFIFIPLVVRELTSDVWTTYVGLFSGLLLLPINQVSPSLYAHPTSQALMYAPAFLFVFLILYRNRIVRTSMLFLLVASMFVLLHPQQAANFVLFFGVIAALQTGYDLYRGYHGDRWKKWVLPEVMAYSTVFWLWATNFDTFWSTLESLYTIPFRETQAAESTAQRSVSLAEVGGSLPEVFVKLFLVSLVYVLLTGLLLFLVVRRSTWSLKVGDRYDIVSDGGTLDRIDRMLLLYIFGGLVAVTILFFVYVLRGGSSDQYFRLLGFLMVLGTVLGSLTFGRIMRYVRHRLSDPAARRSIAFVLVLCLALSVPVVFASPYIYASSDHVTERQMSGYETTFEYQDESIAFDKVRQSPSRFGSAIQGREIPREAYYREGERRGQIPDHFANRMLRTYYGEPIYVPLPEADRLQDAVLWKGFRFSHEDFEYLDNEPGINKIQANGGYDLYLVQPTNASVRSTR